MKEKLYKTSKISILITTMLTLQISSALATDNDMYFVTDIIDGDTVKIIKNAGGSKVNFRIEGIDCPELDQPYGPEAKEFTRHLLQNKYIFIISRSDVPRRDKYNRLLGYVMIVNGPDAQVELVKNGYAWLYRPNNEKTHFPQDLLSPSNTQTPEEIEEYAKTNKLGLWSGDKPIAPWEWRKMRKKK